jgi:tyrosyl-tRNA synthetase
MIYENPIEPIEECEIEIDEIGNIVEGSYKQTGPTGYEWLSQQKYLISIEGRQIYASKSEIRRWFENGSVEVNGKRVKANDLLEFPVKSIVLHPKSKRRTTLI